MDVSVILNIATMIFVCILGIVIKRIVAKIGYAQKKSDEEARENARLHIKGNILRTVTLVHNCDTIALLIRKMRDEDLNGDLKDNLDKSVELREEMTEYNIEMTEHYSMNTVYK